eukprot:6869332-Prymnesium_polylepis.1
MRLFCSVYSSAGTASRTVSLKPAPKTLRVTLVGVELLPSPPMWVSSSVYDMMSLSSSVSRTATVGAGFGALTRCCVKRVSATVVQCSTSRMESVTMAASESFIPCDGAPAYRCRQCFAELQ